jgi:putative ABC transport system substrate-binding protein
MRRRDFTFGLGGAAASSLLWPLAARAQRRVMPVIGLLNGVSFESYAERVAAWRQGLKETGFVEGQNVAIEYRSADGQYDRVRALADDLVRRQVAVIVVIGAAPPLVVKAATSTIPIVFATGSDALNTGLVARLNRPEANMTGVSFVSNPLGPKRLEILRTLVPEATVIAFLQNPAGGDADDAKDIVAAGQTLGRRIVVLDARTEQEIDAAFATMVQQRIGALVVSNDAFLNSRRAQIAGLAARHKLPAIYAYREHVQAGGLISYGTDVLEMYRWAGVYTGRILRGEKPADLPVMQPTRFELIINLKTAKALGLDVPPLLLALANEVIE